MPILIGTDEAGYGPNLGPLAIGGTAWNVPNIDVDLYEQLESVVSGLGSPAEKINICDSKKLYSSSGSIRKLETSVLAIVLAHCGQIPENVIQLAQLFNNEFDEMDVSKFVWNSGDLELPLASDPQEIAALAHLFGSKCKEMNIALQDIHCRTIFPYRFNRLLNTYGNKAELLSANTLRLVNDLVDPVQSPTRVFCDKHGGRSKYVALLNEYLTEQFVLIEQESRAISRYSWGHDKSRFEIVFQSKGESNLPTALASMIAKYFREVCMEVWNRFWIHEVPGLKPTKGYPVDARRFKSEIADTQIRLGICDESIWRAK